MTIDTIEPTEARILGVLIEKAMTTPENYPLSLNAAVSGANQKSNRHPVLAVEDDEALEALEVLAEKRLAKRVFPGHSRVEKFSHTAGGRLGLNSACLAVLAELLLRGPQTLGELRTRARRMAPLDSLEQVQNAIEQLSENRLCKRVAPEPGGRAERYAQLLAPASHPIDELPPARASRPATTAAPAAATAPSATSDLEERVALLERKMRDLERQLGIGTD